MYCRDLEKRISRFTEGINFQQSKREANKRGLLKGIALGTVVGAVLGVLYAPEKGAVTREKTKEEIRRLKEEMEDRFDQGKEKATELLEEKKGRAEEIWLSTKTGFSTDTKETEEDDSDEEKE